MDTLLAQDLALSQDSNEEARPLVQGGQVSFTCTHKKELQVKHIPLKVKHQNVGLVNSNNRRSFSSQDLQSLSGSLWEVVMGIRERERPKSKYHKDFTYKIGN